MTNRLTKTGVKGASVLAMQVAWALRDFPRRYFTLADIRGIARRWTGCKRLALEASDDDVRKVLDALTSKRGRLWWLLRDGERYAFDDTR